MSSSLFQKKRKKKTDRRISVLRSVFVIFAAVIVFRLFTLQVISASFYSTLASSQHAFYEELFASRGSILVQDWHDGGEYLAAANEPRAFVFADPRKIVDAKDTAIKVGAVLGYELPSENDIENLEIIDGEELLLSDEELKTTSNIFEGVYEDVVEEVIEVLEVEESEEVLEPELVEVEEEKVNEILVLIERFSKTDDPYEPVARGVDQDTLDRILSLDIEGIDYVMENGRSYPEQNIGGHIFGFLGSDESGEKIGSYGIEGYFNDFLAGVNGFLDTQADNAGRWIGIGTRNFERAKNGGDILLTIDRTVQYKICNILNEAVERYEADGGSVVILEPSTGKVIAMCSAPDFDPSSYNMVEDIAQYNNKAIFDAYEPGSVVKPIVMAAALDRGAVTPNTLFNDTGEEKIDRFTIRNSDLEAYGMVTMTEVLQKSLNTGMIFTMRKLGGPLMKDYFEKFGFGKRTGIQLNSESAGVIDSLYKDSEIYYATASYGQGFTTTVLQLAQSYAILANQGMLMQPHIVEEQRYPDGTVVTTIPTAVRQVISKKTATTIGAMLVSVVEGGHATNAAVDGYYIAGKTGTAQVARQDGGVGYQVGVTKVTFAGYGPIEDPVFAMAVMLDHPRTNQWASETAATVYGEIAEFLLQYFEIAPTRK